MVRCVLDAGQKSWRILLEDNVLWDSRGRNPGSELRGLKKGLSDCPFHYRLRGQSKEGEQWKPSGSNPARGARTRDTNGER
jgi:hypothetical protein